ncbi:hypothetical protein, partial [Segatella buccae]|uniref:hypothetical protein n=1 Tax=Segatella buccae TaxID=28126 RepID=UPI001E3EEC59
CDATVALSASDCGSFASLKSQNEKTGGLSRWFKTNFQLWLEHFCGGVSVSIIRHHPTAGKPHLYWCVPHTSIHSLHQITTVSLNLRFI